MIWISWLWRWAPWLWGFATPVLGPVAPLLGAAFQFLWQLIKWFFEGITVCFTHPSTATVLLVVFGGGVYCGIEWDAGKVRDARTELRDLRRANAAAQEQARKDADEAVAARGRAKDAERAKITAEDDKRKAETAKQEAEARAARAESDARRLRALAKSSTSGTAAKGPSLPSVSTVFGGAPAPKR